MKKNGEMHKDWKKEMEIRERRYNFKGEKGNGVLECWGNNVMVEKKKLKNLGSWKC